MSPKIGPISGGRIAGGLPRSVRHARFQVETLEPRLLMAGDIPWQILGQLEVAPTEVKTSQPVTSVILHFPAGDAPVPAVVIPPGDPEQSGVLSANSVELYQVSLGSGTDILQVSLTGTPLPRGDSLQLLVFDQAGDALTDWTADASTSAGFALSGTVSTSDRTLDVAVLIDGPSNAGGIAYHLQVTPMPGSFPPAGDPVPYAGDAGSGVPVVFGTQPPPAPPGGGNGSSGSDQGTGVQVGPVSSSGSGQSTGGPAGSSTQGPSPRPDPRLGAVRTTGSSFDGRDAQVAPAPGTPIDVGPLPASPYEPAVGIFSIGASIERVDQAEATCIEMSLVRLTSGQPGASHDDRSSDPGPGVRAPVLLNDAEDRSHGVDLAIVQAPSDGPGPLRTGKRPSAVAAPGSRRSELGTVHRRSFDPSTAIPLPPVTEDPPWGNLWVSAATLPPIDDEGRPGIAGPAAPRDEASTDEGSPVRWSGRAGAILLGLSGWAVLTVGLYAPDITAAVRRAVRSPMPSSRPRSATSRPVRTL
jgi:hypothetical protein